MTWNEVKLTPTQARAMEEARIGLMNEAPFFAHYFYTEMKELPTLDITTACTDGRRICYNPEYLAGLSPPERVFLLAHEVYHVVSRHPGRMKHYSSEGSLRGLDYLPKLFNFAADFVINADLVKNRVGLCNPSWLYDPSITPDELAEDVYEKLYKKLPQSGPTYGSSQKGGKPDPRAQANGGRFDEVLEPQVDPVTGREDIPDDSEFREAVARAAAAAKAMGNLPASWQKMVDEILDPQISWREHLRMLVTGKIGARHETWDRPNRRRLVLNPMVIMPGRRGYGAKDVAVAVDTSGSIYADPKALAVFFAELCGIMADVRPKRIILIQCDAQVQRVDEATSLDEIAHVRAEGAKGGGGTSFVPPFEWLAENNIRPEALVYLTDMMGSFPAEAPSYPVIWCATTDHPAPFGEVVRVEVTK